jgi:hypothetical protein
LGAPLPGGAENQPRAGFPAVEPHPGGSDRDSLRRRPPGLERDAGGAGLLPFPPRLEHGHVGRPGLPPPNW